MIIVLIILVVFGVLFIGIYNNLVKIRNQVRNAFSQIDVQLNRRYDLIPNLVETAKGYLSHEKDTLEKVVLARNQAIGATQLAAKNPTNQKNFNEFVNADSSLNQALNRMMVVVESYPELKANSTMNQLMEELTSTENKIAFARQAYNDSVMEYNNQREVFPNSFIANSFNFEAATGFKIEDATKRENVKVSFN